MVVCVWHGDNYPGFNCRSKMMNVWEFIILKLVKAISLSPTAQLAPLCIFSSVFSICFTYLSIPRALSSCLFPNSLLFVLSANVFYLSDSVGSSHPWRALGMQVLCILSLCASLSDCMKMNFYGLLIDCPLLYISSLSAIVRLTAHSDIIGLLHWPPFGERSPFLPHQL